MAYLPKDYSQHEVKIVFGLTLKKILIIVFFVFLGFIILKMSFLSWVIRVLLILPLLIITPIAVIYTTMDGDDLFTYLIKLIVFYSSPKYLVYKKELKNNNKEYQKTHTQPRKGNKK